MGLEQSLTKRELEICKLLANGLSRERVSKLLFLAEGTVKNYISSIYEKLGVSNRAQLVAKVIAFENAITVVSDPHITDDVVSTKPTGVKLRLIGVQALPKEIHIAVQSKPFIIGRFDVSVGYKQCDFEFGHNTRAVSRRHASVEMTAENTIIMDLNSRVGTYVNGNRIVPHKQYIIREGDRISFGNLGADYIFER